MYALILIALATGNERRIDFIAVAPAMDVEACQIAARQSPANRGDTLAICDTEERVATWVAGHGCEADDSQSIGDLLRDGMVVMDCKGRALE